MDRCLDDFRHEADRVQYEVDEATKEGGLRSDRGTDRDRGERGGDGMNTRNVQDALVDCEYEEDYHCDEYGHE